MSAFMKKDIEAFRNALESRRADPNLVDPKIDMTIFEKVLMSPKSSEFIKACIEHGADLYQVREKIGFHENIMNHYFLFCRKTTGTVIHFTMQSTHSVQKICVAS